MPGYVIMDAEVTDPDGYEEFKRLASAAIADHGGRYLVRGGALEVLEGEWHPRLVLLEFDTLDTALRFYNSDAYQAAREIRLKTATARVAAVDGTGDERGRMESLIRRYFDACNAADVEGIAACFVPDAVHYFPPGMYDGPFRGATTIGEKWRKAVETIGSYWTIDRMICDPGSAPGRDRMDPLQDQGRQGSPGRRVVRLRRRHRAHLRDPGLLRLAPGPRPGPPRAGRLQLRRQRLRPGAAPRRALSLAGGQPRSRERQTLTSTTTRAP